VVGSAGHYFRAGRCVAVRRGNIPQNDRDRAGAFGTSFATGLRTPPMTTFEPMTPQSDRDRAGAFDNSTESVSSVTNPILTATD
jgi:hypothetical protein